MSSYSVFIPRVFSNIDTNRISDVFDTLVIGRVAHIDLISKTSKTGESYNMAFVHFAYLYTTYNAECFKSEVEDPEICAKIVYDAPWFWVVLPFKEKDIESGLWIGTSIAPSLSSIAPSSIAPSLSTPMFAPPVPYPRPSTSFASPSFALLPIAPPPPPQESDYAAHTLRQKLIKHQLSLFSGHSVSPSAPLMIPRQILNYGNHKTSQRPQPRRRLGGDVSNLINKYPETTTNKTDKVETDNKPETDKTADKPETTMNEKTKSEIESYMRELTAIETRKCELVSQLRVSGVNHDDLFKKWDGCWPYHNK